MHNCRHIVIWCQHVSLFRENFHPLLQVTFSLWVTYWMNFIAFGRGKRLSTNCVCYLFISLTTCVWWRSSALDYLSLKSLAAILKCCCTLFCSAVPAFRLFLFQVPPMFISSIMGSFFTTQLWKGENNLWGMALCPKHSSLPELVKNSAFDILPLGASRAILTRVTVQLLCLLRDHHFVSTWWLSWTEIVQDLFLFTLSHCMDWL